MHMLLDSRNSFLFNFFPYVLLLVPALQTSAALVDERPAIPQVPLHLYPASSNIPHPFSPTTPTKHLHVPAVISLPNGSATIQCWRLLTPFHGYPTGGGSAVSLPVLLDNATWVVMPKGSAEGIHRPPWEMLFILLRGSARITLPSGTHSLDLTAGGNASIVLALDTTGEGHYTEYGGEGSDDCMPPNWMLQVPFRGGVMGLEEREKWEVVDGEECIGVRKM